MFGDIRIDGGMIMSRLREVSTDADFVRLVTWLGLNDCDNW